MHTRGVCEEFMSGSETEEIVEKLSRSLLQRYQDNLNEKLRGSDFMFNGVNYLFYDFNRVKVDLTSNLQNGLRIKMYSKPKK